MAYVTGAAATFADLKSAIETAAVTAGWTLASDILSKGGCFFQLVANQITNPYLRLFGGTGQSGSTLTGQTAATNKGVALCSIAGSSITFPLNYEIHTFANPDEIYCVINYNADFYQQLSFGKSDIPGIGGTGGWYTGSYRASTSQTVADAALARVITGITAVGITGSGSSTNAFGGGLFFDSPQSGPVTSFCHCGLDSVAWRDTTSVTAGIGMEGSNYCASLLTSLPNLSNQATILIPIKGVAVRFDGGRTIISNPRNARYMRIDNVVSGEIIEFGSEQWKVYPMYRKSGIVRNGVQGTPGAQHTGTYGYAIRYTGV